LHEKLLLIALIASNFLNLLTLAVAVLVADVVVVSRATNKFLASSKSSSSSSSRL